MKGGGRAPSTLTSLGKFFDHDGMYARKRPLPLCVLCGLRTPSRCQNPAIYHHFSAISVTTQLLTLSPSSRHELALAFVPHPQYSTRGDTVTFLDFFMYVLYSSLLHLPPPPQIPLCRRMPGSKQGQLRFQHWLSDASHPAVSHTFVLGTLIKLPSSESSMTALFTTTKNHQNITWQAERTNENPELSVRA